MNRAHATRLIGKPQQQPPLQARSKNKGGGVLLSGSIHGPVQERWGQPAAGISSQRGRWVAVSAVKCVLADPDPGAGAGRWPSSALNVGWDPIDPTDNTPTHTHTPTSTAAAGAGRAAARGHAQQRVVRQGLHPGPPARLGRLRHRLRVHQPGPCMFRLVVRITYRSINRRSKRGQLCVYVDVRLHQSIGRLTDRHGPLLNSHVNNR